MSRYEMFSVAQAATELGRKRWFIYQLLDEKKLAYYLIGGRRCISRRDLDEYVNRSRVAALGERKKEAKL
jgi:excisionase family DNA binding protein